MTEKVNLCQCNNCMNIFVDQNPQTGAKLYNVDLTKVTDLQYLKDEEPESDSGGNYYWGCGVCETDGYLNDEIDEVKAKELGIIIN